MILFGDLVEKIRTQKGIPFTMFSLVSIVVLLINIGVSVSGEYRDYTTAIIFGIAIVILAAGLMISRLFSVFAGILLMVVVLNGILFWVSFNLGRAAGAMLYYFPISVGFLYLFLYNASKAKTILLVSLVSLFFVFTMLLTRYRSDSFFLPDPALERIYLSNLVFSILVTVVILATLYRQIIRAHRLMMSEKEQQHREMLREIDTRREQEEYALVLSLRDDIAQQLATARMYLQMPAGEKDLINKADSHVKAALSTLNEIATELSPSMLIDMGLRDGLDTYADILSEKYQLPVLFDVDDVKKDIPSLERLSLYRVLQQCIHIIAGTHCAEYLKITIRRMGKVRIIFEHAAPWKDFAERFRDKRNGDLSRRLQYYSAELTESSGKVEMTLFM
ncbi:MAG: hypothetical protein IAE96_05530 [Chitinophagaceae bacterium]|nr:hypothetical protein [Chitinophagaceae bacterium]